MKGVVYLVEIWDYVCKIRPNAKLALIGNGPKDYEGKVRNEIKKRGLEKNIDLLGFVDGIKKYWILKSSKVYLYTAIYEPSSMAIVDGMACGLPAVRFDIPIQRSVYPKGTLIAPLKNCKVFAENVLRLLENEILYKKVSQDALEVAKEWDWDKRAQDALCYIKKALDLHD